jgi:hypothetical protein
VELVALTVNVDEFPAVMDAGFAVMLTVGAAAGTTVTVAVAEALPPAPVAVAVYVVVAAGVTDCVPPLPGRLYVLPSDPVTATWVAFAAITINVDEAPEVTDVGLAVILTVGATAGGSTVTVTVAEAFPPAPVAVAVYVVLAAGVTVCVPPAACRVYVVLSDPVTTTWVALVAATVRVDAVPMVIDVELAVMLTVGTGEAETVTVAMAVLFPPVPVAVAV